MSNFRRFVQTRYAPLVEVVAHPDVVASLATRDGLTPAALFRPVGEDGVPLNGERNGGECSFVFFIFGACTAHDGWPASPARLPPDPLRPAGDEGEP
jgi:hypothetical protein